MREKMTWEEAILLIRQKPEYADLVRQSYLEADLPLNLERFRSSEEYTETVKWLKQYHPAANALLDIGAGNGISSVAFALDGYRVTAVEPDPSTTVGGEAIRTLARTSGVADRVNVVSAFAESLPFPDGTFDVVYARQAMHHAHNLPLFLKETARVLKKGGVLFTVRDHVANNPAEKARFLEAHPLQHLYGGENAFSLREYREAMQQAGLSVRHTLKHFDSPINFFPVPAARIEEERQQFTVGLKDRLRGVFGPLGDFGPLYRLYQAYTVARYGKPNDEAAIPGRLYSFLAQK